MQISSVFDATMYATKRKIILHNDAVSTLNIANVGPSLTLPGIE